ncbi:MAG: helix-turn-helix transcriptional regulator [Lachnospiraceae bacterium]|nr:helix-turn-helix transcriptional regulator [Lachnospiraceae bacterium]MDD6504534.1 helix-turn-helix transcriptional regulator [Lachnospiraceae bacterium]
MDLTKEWYRCEFINHETMLPHRAIETEFTFYDAVAAGDIEYVQENIKNNTFTNPEGMGKLSETPLQNLRYHFVITTAMVTRYCVHSGMEQEKAYALSDFYILKMDKATSIPEIAELHDKMCLDFCKQMNIIRSSQILSKPIVLCIDYIYSHIHYRITVRELADYLNLSESYLSKLFHKEMGVSVSSYILDLKIDKAKNLLQYSDYNIIDIANYLSFSSQSHFIQTFQKKTGLTPHKYRTRHFRANWEQVETESQ